MSEKLPYPYHLGTRFPVMPNPPTPQHCINIAAGPVTLVVEARDLIDELAPPPGREAATTADATSVFNDFGASLHVIGPDGAEHLRFDCFEDKPHYHYISAAEGKNVICRLDEIAEGDPIEWTIGRLRQRLPEMLDYAGAPALAEAVRADQPAVMAAAQAVHELLQAAYRRAVDRRASGSTLAPSAG